MGLKKAELFEMARSFEGYLEKASNKYLDDFTKNAGDKNYTMFGRDFDKIMGTNFYNGKAWCAEYLCMIMVYTYGLKAAKKLLGGKLSASTVELANAMKAKKGVKPQVGDVVFFYNSTLKRIAHVGLVTEVTSSKFKSIEGNTSSKPGVVRNGGAVREKEYPITQYNAYFAHPDYKNGVKGTDTVPVSTKKPVASKPTGNGNPYKAPASTGVVLKKGSKGESVRWAQYELNRWKSTLEEDGDFGSKTEKQAIAYQKAYGLTPDGQIGPKTIAMLKNDGK